jgi:Xaa-Pro dipeptidase
MFPGTEIPFSRREYQHRLERIRALMNESGIDVIYLTAPDSMYYVSGYQATWYQTESPKAWPAIAGIAVHREKGDMILFEQAGHATLCHYQTVCTDIRLYQRDTRGLDAIGYIAAELDSEGWLDGATAALEMWSHRPNRAISEQFQAAFEARGSRVVDGSDILRTVRSIKSPQELAYIETAMRIADIGMQTAIDTLAPGLTELEVHGEIIAAMAAAGGEHTAIPIPVISGTKTFVKHVLPSRKVIMTGDHIKIDVSGVYHRYHANIARSFSIGEPHPEVEKRVEISAGVFDMLAEIIRPGMPVNELNDKVREYYIDTGIWDHRVWIGGYELGTGFPPDWVGPFVYGQELDPGDKTFDPGMVVNYESQFYLPHRAGQSSLIDTLIFTEEEARILGKTPRELIVIEV